MNYYSCGKLLIPAEYLILKELKDWQFQQNRSKNVAKENAEEQILESLYM